MSLKRSGKKQMKKLLICLILLFPVTATASFWGTANWNFWVVGEEGEIQIGGDSGVWIAQTFESGHTAPVLYVSFVMVCYDGGAGSVSAEIQGLGADGRPNGVVLGRGKGNTRDINPGGILNIYGLPVIRVYGANLEAGTSYAMVISGDANADCKMQQGASPTGANYSGGEAFVALPSRVPVWEQADFYSGDDLAFTVYVHVPDIQAPGYCDVANYSGIPASWLDSELPVCSCVSDEVLSHHRCWFAFPEWTLWRDMPSPHLDPKGKATWQLVPINSDFPGLTLEESDADGFSFSDPVNFPAGLTPAKAKKQSSNYNGAPTATLVDFEFEIDGEPAWVQFETLIDAPPQ